MRNFFVLFIALFIVACNPANVEFDSESPSFVDRESAVGIDKGLPKQAPADVILNESSEGFVPPPLEDNITVNGETQDAELPAQLRGRSLVTLWVWNEYGSQRLLVSENTGVGVPRLKVTVEVASVTSDDGGKAAVSVNSKPARIMRAREETRFDNTYVFVREIIAAS